MNTNLGSVAVRRGGSWSAAQATALVFGIWWTVNGIGALLIDPNFSTGHVHGSGALLGIVTITANGWHGVVPSAHRRRRDCRRAPATRLAHLHARGRDSVRRLRRVGAHRRRQRPRRHRGRRLGRHRPHRRRGDRVRRRTADPVRTDRSASTGKKSRCSGPEDGSCRCADRAELRSNLSAEPRWIGTLSRSRPRPPSSAHTEHPPTGPPGRPSFDAKLAFHRRVEARPG